MTRMIVSMVHDFLLVIIRRFLSLPLYILRMLGALAELIAPLYLSLSVNDRTELRVAVAFEYASAVVCCRSTTIPALCSLRLEHGDQIDDVKREKHSPAPTIDNA